MDESSLDNQHAFIELEKASRKLDEVESRMKKFRSKKKQAETHRADSQVKAPYPDLTKYFTHLAEGLEQPQQNDVPLLAVLNPPSEPGVEVHAPVSYPQTTPKVVGRAEWTDNKENSRMNINQKLQQEKNSSITKIEEYYAERNQILEDRIAALKQKKETVIKEQGLLARNNRDLDQKIQQKRQQPKQNRGKADDLVQKIATIRAKIEEMDSDNAGIVDRKKQMEKHIREALRHHKVSLSQELRPKSSSGRCPYH